MTQSESFSNSLYTDQMHLAERELSAFIAAVAELSIAASARLATRLNIAFHHQMRCDQNR